MVTRGFAQRGLFVLDPVTGEVKKSNVDMGTEMVNLVAAQRGFQANVSVLQQARDAYQAALRLH